MREKKIQDEKNRHETQYYYCTNANVQSIQCLKACLFVIEFVSVISRIYFQMIFNYPMASKEIDKTMWTLLCVFYACIIESNFITITNSVSFIDENLWILRLNVRSECICRITDCDEKKITWKKWLIKKKFQTIYDKFCAWISSLQRFY